MADKPTDEELRHTVQALQQKKAALRQAAPPFQGNNSFITTVLDTLGALVVVLDRTGRIVHFNRACEQITGYTLAEVKGCFIWDFLLLPEDVEPVRQVFNALLAGRFPNQHENYWVSKEGQNRLIQWSNSALLDQQDEVEYVFATGIDITEQKRAEEILRAREELLRLFVLHTPVAVAMFDRHMRYLAVSRRWLEDFNLGDQSILGRCHYDVFPNAPDRWRAIHQRCLAGAVERCEQESFPRADGGIDWFRWEIRPWFSANQEIGGIISFNEVITARKQAEEVMAQSTEAIKLFAYSVSHDLKNPAISLYGLAEILRKNYMEQLDDRGQRCCEQISRSSEQVLALVDKINIYIATKESCPNFEPVRIKEIIQMVKDEFAPQINLRRIRWSEPDHIPTIIADRLSLLRLFRNLVDNSLKYGGDTLSQITINHEEQEACHLLSLQDNGIGIKKGDSKKIFGLFKRVETSRGIQGTGLGLAIAKEIAQQHGGNVWAEPGRKRGITFFMSIAKDLGR